MERPHATRLEAEQQRARGVEWLEEVGLLEPLLNSSGCWDPLPRPRKDSSFWKAGAGLAHCRQPWGPAQSRHSTPRR